MDFSFSDEQLAVREAAEAVFGGIVDPERVAEVEKSAERVDRELWAALASADLLGLAVPAEHGGGGLGLTELCLVLESQGRCLAPVPVLSTLVLGALPLARFGTADQRANWLPGVAAGRTYLTAALASAAERLGFEGQDHGGTSAADPPLGVQARPGAGGWRFSGVELAVPQGHLAHRILVPAAVVGGGTMVALVDPGADGARLERAVTTNREVHPHLHLRDVGVPGEDVIAGPAEGAGVLRAMLQAAWTGICALQLGVAESALGQTAEYLNQRHQFGRPLSTFQGTLLRAGDAAIDIEAMRVTLWQAAWRIDTGRDAAEAVAVAKWQAAERGQRVVHATQHLHGGIGADVSYPIHRYFLWGKQNELLFGGPSRQLARLGRLVAERANPVGSAAP